MTQVFLAPGPFGAGGQFFGLGGLPLNAGTISTYAAGGTTPLATYTSSAGSVQNANPIVLGTDGRPPNEIWITSAAYRFDLKDALGNLIKTYDNLGGFVDSASLAASTGSSLVGFIQSGTGAVARPVQSVLRERTFSVLDYGAVGDGVTNDTTAIQNTINAAVAAGGGIIYFPNTSSNTYYLGSAGAGTVSVPVPVSGLNFTTTNNTLAYHFYILNKSGLSFLGNGVTLKSGVTSGGGCFVLFDGCKYISWDGISLLGTVVFTPSTGAITTYGYDGLCFTSTAQDSEFISIKNVQCNATYAAIYCFGGVPSSYRVRGLLIQNVLATATYYGLVFADNGDDVTVNNFRTYGINARVYFVYGVSNHRVNARSYNSASPQNNLYGQILIKAYDKPTSDIDLTFVSGVPSNGGIAQVYIQSQHVPAYQAVPALVRNIRINLDDSINTVGSPIIFNYVTGGDAGGGAGVYTATVAYQIFDDILISGVIYDANQVTSTVIQSPFGYLDMSQVTFVINPTAFYIYLANGFVDNKNVICNSAFNDGSLHSLGLTNNLGGMIIVRDAGGVAEIPFYSSGGNGTAYKTTYLSVTTGWVFNNTVPWTDNFTMNGTGGQTYQISGAVGGTFSIQRTVGATTYQVYCIANSRLGYH